MVWFIDHTKHSVRLIQKAGKADSLICKHNTLGMGGGKYTNRQKITQTTQMGNRITHLH